MVQVPSKEEVTMYKRYSTYKVSPEQKIENEIDKLKEIIVKQELEIVRLKAEIERKDVLINAKGFIRIL